MNTLLITGGTGYIGRKLAEYFMGRELEIRLMVRSINKLAESLRCSCRLIINDITRSDEMKKALSGVDAVIHAAGLLGQWKRNYEELYEVNVRGTMNLIRRSFDAGVKKFIHLSAGGVTGPVQSESADESYAPEPRTDYEKTKWEGERLALELADKEDLNLLVIRPTFTYGPGDPHKLPLFRSIQKGRFAFIGDGLSMVHPIYIDDLISGIDLGLKNKILKKTSVIIGGPRPVTKRELIFGISDLLHVKRPKIKIPVAVAVISAICCEMAARILKFNPPITRSRILALSENWGYSIKKARQALGYNPKYDLQEGLKLTISDYRRRGWL